MKEEKEVSTLVAVMSALDGFWLCHRYTAIPVDSTPTRLYGTYHQARADGTERIFTNSSAFWLDVTKYSQGKEFLWEVQVCYGTEEKIAGFHFTIDRDRKMRIAPDLRALTRVPTDDEVETLLSFLRC